MKGKSLVHKGFKLAKENFPRRVAVKTDMLPVTLTPNVPKTGAKRYGAAGVLGAAKRLAPWFAIANRTAKLPLHLPECTFDISDSDFELVQQSVRGGFEQLTVVAERRRTKEPTRHERYARTGLPHAGTIHLPWTADQSEFWGDLIIGLDDRLAPNPSDLRGRFARALEGAELDRFRRCPICEHFFYRVRTDTRGDGCSADCNNTLRQQRFRGNLRKKEKKYRAAPKGREK
jgi:hypothetical protein